MDVPSSLNNPLSAIHPLPFPASARTVTGGTPTGRPTTAAGSPTQLPAKVAMTDLREIPLGAPEPPGTTGDDEELTIAGLLKVWGKNDTQYDLNNDGVVDMADLVSLLSRMREKPTADIEPGPRTGSGTAFDLAGAALQDPPPVVDDATSLVASNDASLTIHTTVGAPPPDAPPPGAPPPDPPPLTNVRDEADPDPLPTVAGLLKAWGTDRTRFDLNRDGTVNMADLVQLLSELSRIEDDGQVITTNVRDLARDLAFEGRLTLNNLLRAWGTEHGRFDLDRDGTVNMGDILQFLTRGRHQVGAPEDRPRPVKAMARSLVDRLQAQGFVNHPPTNIHSVVARAHLDAFQQNELLERLNEAYPDGLGVNVVG